MSRGRLLLGLLLILLAATGWTAWLVWQVRSDLAEARLAAERLQAAVRSGDAVAREEAADALADSAGSAGSATDGVTWAALTHLPVVGDDAAGVRALADSLDVVARQAVGPLNQTLDGLAGATGRGGVDVRAVQRLQRPVAVARDAMVEAHDTVAAVDSHGFAGALRGPFDEYVVAISGAREALTSAATATEVLPGLLGADEPRRYLLVFQNNAEIRATGGLPGSWALVEAEAGQLRLVEQEGTAGAFPSRDDPVIPISDAERRIFGPQLGTYFQDANFTPDYPRVAELWTAWWQERSPGRRLDGVLTLDPVTLSYLLEGSGPVEAAGGTLTPKNVVEELLSRTYRELDPLAQDLLFAEVAQGIFDAVSGELASPLDFVQGLARATAEGRFRFAPLNSAEAEALAGTRVLGELSGDDGSTPHVDIGVNDATGSKMSYYLRYDGDVIASSCRDGVQQLSGTLGLRQTIPPREARTLPESVTGTSRFGTTPGSQLVLVRVHAPYGGAFGEFTLDGRTITRDVEVVELDRRPVATLVALLSSTEEQQFGWTMETGPGQTDDGELQLTPGVEPGPNRVSFTSGC